MNRRNFVQFNPNSYKKHLSPFGQNVLDTLIKHWRTGFDNKENRYHHHQFIPNHRTNAGGVNCDSIQPIPYRDTSCERDLYPKTDNLVTHNNRIPIGPVPAGQPCNASKDIGKTYYENDNNQQVNCLNDGQFAMRRIPVDRAPQAISKIYYENIATEHADSIIQQQKQNFNDLLPDVSIKQMLHDGTHSDEIPKAVVPVSTELVKTVEIPNTNDEEILTANDMVTPVINFDKVNENFFSSRKHINKIDNTDMPPLQFLQILTNDTTEKQNRVGGKVEEEMSFTDGLKKDVEWDDMFDTEQFPDLNAPQQLIAPHEDDGNSFKIEFPKDKKRNQTILENKVVKRKTQSKNSKVSEVLPKRVKKSKGAQDFTETPKKNFRKIKCTKAVQKWLYVDPNISAEDRICRNNPNEARILSRPVVETFNDKVKVNGNKDTLDKNKVQSVGTELILQKETEKSKTESRSHVKEVINEGSKGLNPKRTILDETVIVSSTTDIQRNTKGKNKKVVQARLAQKDGKMKFGPPTRDANDTKIEKTIDNETKHTDLIKEKKTKTKFVAPIKSQIPVKNVSFDVKTIDDSNLHLIHDLILDENNEIAIILTYSNGFSQLNNHHTEDTCIPEGILIQSHDQFFYFKDNCLHSDIIRQLMEGLQVICYNGKELLIYLTSKYGIELKQDAFNVIDAKIGGSLIDPDNPPENFAELQKLLGFTPEFTIATECVLQKTAWYTTLLRECFDKLKTLLMENSVWNIFVQIEMRLLPVISGMEQCGVCVNLEKLKSMEQILLTKMKAVEQECYKAAGKTFQINSALQVRTILYDELQLDTKSNLKIKETVGRGAKSTSETMLRGLVSLHPLPRLILEYRHLHKAYATFLTGIAQHVKDGLVKPTWVQTAAATGRIASNNPNLQAIPKAPFSLVMFPETSEDQGPQLNFRCVYIARPGHWLVAADFKHVECRVFAHAAADAALLSALRDQRDLFQVLAAKWLNKPVDDISKEDRERTKRIVYASLYGAGARKLMEILQVSYEQALSIMSSFNRTFPALKTFGQAAVERARAGSLRTLCGRARRFRHIASADAALRAHAERQAVNFVVQGSAADLCKSAMVAVQRQLEQQSLRGRLLLQIHDELVWEVADDHVDRAAAMIRATMENVGRQCGMELALPVALSRGRSWDDMQPLPDSPQS